MIKPYYETPNGKLYHEACLDILPFFETADIILSDPPYQITNCKWDFIIPLEPMWRQLKRIIKPNGAIIMTAAQPFTSILTISNLKWFKYSWVWKKGNKPTNFLNAKKQPLRITEDVLVFYRKQPTYNPQMIKGRSCHKRGTRGKTSNHQTANYGKYLKTETMGNMKYPQNLINIPRDKEKFHPTQKPVALMEYLIKTYTNKGETALDFAAGSGTTGIACERLNRKYILIEKELEYVEIAAQRITREIQQTKMF